MPTIIITTGALRAGSQTTQEIQKVLFLVAPEGAVSCDYGVGL
jgi:hypothetical protein